MRKNILISTLSLILLSTIAKILSFIVRIYLARNLPIVAMNYYSIAMPTLVFIIALAQMGIPPALSKMIAQSQNSVNGILSSFILSLINNSIVISIFVLLIPLLSTTIFHDEKVSEILKSMIFMIPLVTLSGLTKAILQGKQHHMIATSSQIFEEIFRLVYLMFYFSSTIDSSIQYASIAMKSIFIGECGSALFMILFILLKKHPFKRRQHDLKKEHFIEILSSSIPMTSARLVGSFTYFLEPLIFFSFSSSFLFKTAYGTFNGYVLPLLTMPSFISITLSSVLLPTFVYEKKHMRLEKAKKIFYMISFICIFISSCCGLLTFFFSSQILELFYHTTQGSLQLKLTSLPFVFYSLQPVFSSMLHALDKSKEALLDTIIGCILRLLILCFFPYLINEHSLIIAITFSMLITTLLHAIRVIFSLQVLK